MKFNDATNEAKIALLAIAVGALLEEVAEEIGEKDGKLSAKEVFSLIGISETDFTKLSRQTVPEVDEQIAEITKYPVGLLHMVRYTGRDNAQFNMLYSRYAHLSHEVLLHKLAMAGVITKSKFRNAPRTHLIEALYRYNVCVGKDKAVKL